MFSELLDVGRLGLYVEQRRAPLFGRTAASSSWLTRTTSKSTIGRCLGLPSPWLRIPTRDNKRESNNDRNFLPVVVMAMVSESVSVCRFLRLHV